jgi:hypothetical protein
MAEGQQDHGGVAVAVAVVTGRLHHRSISFSVRYDRSGNDPHQADAGSQRFRCHAQGHDAQRFIYSITSTARRRIDVGNSRLMALAVLSWRWE